jgi:hypothetical protein
MVELCLHFPISLYDIVLKCSRLKHYATSRKVAGSSPDEVIGFFSIDLIPLAALWPWGRISLLTEMSTRN